LFEAYECSGTAAKYQALHAFPSSFTSTLPFEGIFHRLSCRSVAENATMGGLLRALSHRYGVSSYHDGQRAGERSLY
jgi:hypothetical protein